MPTFPKTRWLLVLCLSALLTPITHGQSLAKVTPQEAGLSSTALQQIDVLLQQAVERKQVAGAVALLARDGKLGYLRATGFQDVEAGKEMITDTLFRIASMSKPVTSVAVMILVDDGRLTVDDPVSKYLPEFKNPKVLMPGSGGDSKLVPASGGEWNGTRILKPATVREMTSNQIGDLEFMSPTDRFGYGFGIVAGADKEQVAAVGSYYRGGFYGTGFWVDPEKKLVGVFMTQLRSDQQTLYEDFMKLAYAATQ